MKKWLWIAGAVVVVVVAVIAIGLSKLGTLLTTAVNTYGPRITRTDVNLGDVSVSLFSGKATLTDFSLGNPKGFTAPRAMTVGSVVMQVDERSLTRNPVVIDRIVNVRPEITYERAAGTDYLQTILQNVQQALGAQSSTATPAASQGGGKKLLIRDLRITGGRVTLALAALPDKTVTAALPVIHLQNLGQRIDGAVPAEAVREVLAAVYGEVTSPAMTAAFTQGLQHLGVTAVALGPEGSHLARAVRGEATTVSGSAVRTAGAAVKGLLGY